MPLSTKVTPDNQADIAISAAMLDSGSKVQVAEINIMQGTKTARFWVSVNLSPSGRPVCKLVANEAKGERTTAVNGSFLDLQARRAERKSAGKALIHPYDLRDCGDKD